MNNAKKLLKSVMLGEKYHAIRFDYSDGETSDYFPLDLVELDFPNENSNWIIISKLKGFQIERYLINLDNVNSIRFTVIR